MTAPRPLDIFHVLSQLDKKSVEYYDTLTDGERKSIQPFVLIRWLSGTSDAAQVMMLNEVANPYLFSLQQHKKLMWELLSVCTSGKTRRYQWNKMTNGSKSKRPISTEVVARYYHYSMTEAKDAVELLGIKGVLDLAEELGMQPDEIKKIQKEFK